MNKEESLKVTNYKISWKSKRIFSTLKDYRDKIEKGEGVGSVRSYTNFLIVRVSPPFKGVYTIFESGFVNCTGLVTISDCNQAVRVYKQWFDHPPPLIEGFKIDCLSAHCNLGKKINLRQIQNKIKAPVNIIFAPEIFAGCIVRFLGVRGEGSASVFGNGKITFVGGKCTNDIERIYNLLMLILNTSQAWQT